MTKHEPQKRGYLVKADDGVDNRSPEVKASSHSTGGSLAVYRSVVDGEGPPPHIHTHEDETIFVLAGTIEAECGDEVFTATEGDLVFLPRHFQHTFRSIGGPAEILFLVTPGHLDEFFVERDRLLAKGADRTEVAKLASTYF